MPPKKYERKKGFYCELTAEQIKDSSIWMNHLHYDDLGKSANKNKYFVYYDSINKDEKSEEVLGNLYAITARQHYANEHYDDLTWCQENRDFLQPLIKEDFDKKYGKYGEDFKFDLDIFNYAFLGSKEDLMGLGDSEKRTQLNAFNKEIDQMMADAAAENKELNLHEAIKSKSEDLKQKDHVATTYGCQRAMKLAMANYSHKIMELDMPNDKKKELFGEILLSYKDTMTTMLATIDGGYEKDYNVGNIDFGCLETNQLIEDLNTVVPTEFLINVGEGAKKNKDLDTVIKNSRDNKKLVVEDKEFIGETYKVTRENYAKRNGFVVFLSKVPLLNLFPSVRKERETIEKIEKFADEFDLGKTPTERIKNLTGITDAKKNKVVAEMAGKFVASAQVDVNNLLDTVGTVIGSGGVDGLGNDRFRTLTKADAQVLEPVFNRFYAGKALNKIGELPGVSEYFKPIDKEEERAFTKNTKYIENIKPSSKKLSYEEYDSLAHKFQQVSEILDRETAISSFNKDCLKDGKPIVFSLDEKIKKATDRLNELDFDVPMKGATINEEKTSVENQEEIRSLDDLEKHTKDNYSKENGKENLSQAVDKEKTKDEVSVSNKNI